MTGVGGPATLAPVLAVPLVPPRVSPAVAPVPLVAAHARPAWTTSRRASASAVAALGAAESAVGSMVPGAQVGMQLANRAVGYMGQLGGIAAEGLLETFLPNDTALGDPSKSPLGRIALGFAGAHPTAPNNAGQTAPPLAPPDQGQGAKGLGQGQVGPNIGVQIQNTHVQNGDGEAVARDINRNVARHPFETR